MMIGKRGRPPIKRTASMTEFTLDFTGAGVSSSSDVVYPPLSPSPRHLHRRNSADFLTVCSLCHRRLIPGRDIYMYRGDNAFCSEEYRQQQMTQDESIDKCSLASKTTHSTSFATEVRVSCRGV